MQERVKTGTGGLDKLVEGGIPRGSLTILAGSLGSGKTIASAQFLHYGATHGELGICISYGERKEVFFDNMKQFGLDFEKLARA